MDEKSYNKRDYYFLLSNPILKTKNAIDAILVIIKNNRTGCSVRTYATVADKAQMVEILRKEPFEVLFLSGSLP